MRIRSRLVRNATIATLVGGAGGAVGGLWSVRDPMTSLAVSQMSTGAGAAASPRDAASRESGRHPTALGGQAESIATATSGVARSTAADAAVGSPPAPSDSQDVVQRARALAQRPDVSELVALRESITRLAHERGDQESPATKELLRQVDQYLNEARQLRLKLDGEALKRSEGSNPPRTSR